jgi:hypothetical protein
VDVATYVVRVSAEMQREQEGRYRVTGTAGTTPIDLMLELYLDDPGESGRFSAFVEGTTSDGPVKRSGDGVFGIYPGAGASDSNTFQYSFETHSPAPSQHRRYSLVGTRAPGGVPFPVAYLVTDERGATRLRATVTARQLSGPGQPP